MVSFRLILAVTRLAEKEFRAFIKSRMDQQEAEFSKNRKTNFKALPYFASMIKEIHVYQVSSRRQYGGSSVDFINWSTTARGEAERKEARNNRNSLHERRT